MTTQAAVKKVKKCRLFLRAYEQNKRGARFAAACLSLFAHICLGLFALKDLLGIPPGMIRLESNAGAGNSNW
jgi:hypothetical protein